MARTYSSDAVPPPSSSEPESIVGHEGERPGADVGVVGTERRAELADRWEVEEGACELWDI